MDCKATRLHELLSGPTLIHLQGQKQQPMFISVLLHGNEYTGLLAIQSLLQKYHDKPLPRSLSILFGNIEAARLGVRKLEDGPDFNRIWPGMEHPPCVESKIMQAVVDEMQQRDVFISVDVHNNTGLNPHFACVNSLQAEFLNLANLFSRLTVYFLRPKGVQSAAFAKMCPAVTLECGKPGVQYGIEHAADFLDTCLHLDSLPNTPPPHHNIDLFHTVARVMIPEQYSFSFDNSNADLLLNASIDRMNFTEINAGTVLGRTKTNSSIPLYSRAENGMDNTAEYFQVDNGVLSTRKAVMPSMFTLNETVIRQDCLCYLMERMTDQSLFKKPIIS